MTNMAASIPLGGAVFPANPIDRTTADIIREYAVTQPDAPSILTSDGHVVTYRSLVGQMTAMADALRQAGIGTEDWVAVALPDGADLAVMIVALAGCATAIPINPELAPAELDELFMAAKMTAVILASTDNAAAVSARKRGLGVFVIVRSQNGIDLLLLSPPLTSRTDSRAIDADSIAFILRTSGTTARPKLVAVTHRNLVATATAVQEWFALTTDDKALCALPLYYAVALKVGVFTTLLSGGSVVCAGPTPGGGLLDLIERFRPSWYSASPAVHCAALEHARSSNRPIRHALRFIHSGAAPLPEAVHDGLEAIFAAPVLQTYGLSEAGLIAANTFAPEGRRRGSVGKRRPGELACRDDDGRILPADELGEIVARGPGVTPGYIDDPEANAIAFADGWFRTGDVGRIDHDGFVTIIGRLKEIINRGGEKIAPSEIDEALLHHPAVAEAAAFPIPHPSLGEDVAAAVVFRAGKTATTLELRQFLRTMLAPHKIPRHIRVVEALPRNATGKVKRLELAESIPESPGGAPVTRWNSPLEVQIAEIWHRLLQVDDIARDDEFFARGGDSLLEAQMLLELEQITGRTLPQDLLFESATVPQLAESIVRSDTALAEKLLIEVQPGAGRPPFIFVDGDFWGGGYYTRKIARLLGPEYPFYDLRSHGLRDGRIPPVEAMARDYLSLVRSVQPHGPYRIGGHCNGALTALALAEKLEAIGERVELLVLIEPITLNARPAFRFLAHFVDKALRLTTVDAFRRQELFGATMSLAWRAVRRAHRLHRRKDIAAGDDLDALTQRVRKFDAAAAKRYADLLDQYHRTMASYLPAAVNAQLLCIVAESHEDDIAFASGACRRLALRCEAAVIPGEHMTCITTHAEALTELIRERLHAFDGWRSAGGP
jgi:oxalate---CoA ligase